MILTIIATVITFVYVLAALLKSKGEIPPTLSDTAYVWESNCDHNGQTHKGYWFTLYCFVTSALVFYPWICATSDNFQFLCFLGCAGMLFAGITPFFRTENYWIHLSGGTLAVASVLIWFFVSGFWGFSVFLIIIFIVGLKEDAFFFLGEVLSLFFLMITLSVLSILPYTFN